VGKPVEQNTLGKQWRKWANNIKTDLRETKWGGIHRSDLPQDKDQWSVLENTITNLRVPETAGKF
jgi:hypothetical protein